MDKYTNLSQNFKIYKVGGAVRDELLGMKPKDNDWVIVGANEDDVQKLLSSGFTQVGADFPVFLHPETNDEYALARVERKVGTGYLGFEVKADENVSIQEDLSRRDLTINSIAKASDGTLIDPFNGLKDIRNRVLRHTSAAFVEDPLRVLRLARFAARMPSWTIAPETIDLCKVIAKNGELNALSIERFWAEMEKAFSEKDPGRFMEVLDQTDALKHCKFLCDLFGSSLTKVQKDVLNVLKKNNILRNKLTISTSVLAVRNSELIGANNIVRDCFNNVHALGNTQGGVDDLFALLKKARVQSEGPQFNDFIYAVQVCELAGINFVFSSTDLILGSNEMRSVKASQFNSTGKALGDDIKQAQLNKLKIVLNQN